jgi:chromosome segregation ATPase
MRRLPWIALALVVVAVVVLVFPLVRSQQHLRAVQNELRTTNEQVVKLEKVIANLKTELDSISKARTQLQGHLDEANYDNDQLRKELDASQSQLKEKEGQAQQLTTELEKTKKETYAQLAAQREAIQKQFESLTNEATKKLSESERRIADLTEQLNSVSAERDAAQTKLSENQSEFEAIENELAKAKEATQEASAKASELENAANHTKDAEAERTQIQSALDQANKEIERLKTELDQQKAIPPVSVSPPQGETSPPASTLQ